MARSAGILLSACRSCSHRPHRSVLDDNHVNGRILGGSRRAWQKGVAFALANLHRTVDRFQWSELLDERGGRRLTDPLVKSELVVLPEGVATCRRVPFTQLTGVPMCHH